MQLWLFFYIPGTIWFLLHFVFVLEKNLLGDRKHRTRWIVSMIFLDDSNLLSSIVFHRWHSFFLRQFYDRRKITEDFQIQNKIGNLMLKKKKLKSLKCHEMEEHEMTLKASYDDILFLVILMAGLLELSKTHWDLLVMSYCHIKHKFLTVIGLFRNCAWYDIGSRKLFRIWGIKFLTAELKFVISSDFRQNTTRIPEYFLPYSIWMWVLLGSCGSNFVTLVTRHWTSVQRVSIGLDAHCLFEPALRTEVVVVYFYMRSFQKVQRRTRLLLRSLLPFATEHDRHVLVGPSAFHDVLDYLSYRYRNSVLDD